LNVDRSTNRIDSAWKFCEDRISGGVEDATLGPSDKIVKDSSVGDETAHRLLLILRHESAVSNEISSENGRNLPLQWLPPQIRMAKVRQILSWKSQPIHLKQCSIKSWDSRDDQSLRCANPDASIPDVTMSGSVLGGVMTSLYACSRQAAGNSPPVLAELPQRSATSGAAVASGQMCRWESWPACSPGNSQSK
jgi:hypothetical protein